MKIITIMLMLCLSACTTVQPPQHAQETRQSISTFHGIYLVDGGVKTPAKTGFKILSNGKVVAQ